MMSYIRYSLACVCFAASVGCLALLWRSYFYADQVTGQTPWQQTMLGGESRLGLMKGIRFPIGGAPGKRIPFRHKSERVSEKSRRSHAKLVDTGSFSRTSHAIFFPHWYASLIFALTGVGVLRFRRQFSIRSALVVVSVVAALLGMAVVL